MSKEPSYDKPKAFKCKYCGQTFDELWKLGNHVKYECDAAKLAKEKLQEIAEETPPEPEKKMEARQLVAQFGREGLNKLKRQRLKTVLGMAPGVGKKAIPWIMHKWDVNARLRDDPMEFWRMLHDDAGLKPQTATSIVRDVFSLEEEFADLLYKRGEQPIFFRPYGTEVTSPPAFMPQPYIPTSAYPPTYYPSPSQRYQQPTYQPPPWQPPSQWMLPYREEELARKMRDMVSEEFRRLDDRFKEIEKRLEVQPQPRVYEADREEEVWEPMLDEKGRVRLDDEGNIVFRRRFVKPKKGLTAEDVRRIIKDELPREPELTAEKVRQIIKEETKPEPLTPEKVRQIMREESKPKVEKSSEVTALETRLNEVTKKYDELKESMEKKEKEELLGTIRDLRSRIDSLSRMPTGEWQSDEMKVISQTLGEIAGILREKKPMETIERLLARMPAVPPGAMPPPETRTGIIQQLRERGLTVPK